MLMQVSAPGAGCEARRKQFRWCTRASPVLQKLALRLRVIRSDHGVDRLYLEALAGMELSGYPLCEIQIRAISRAESAHRQQWIFYLIQWVIDYLGLLSANGSYPFGWALNPQMQMKTTCVPQSERV